MRVNYLYTKKMGLKILWHAQNKEKLQLKKHLVIQRQAPIRVTAPISIKAPLKDSPRQKSVYIGGTAIRRLDLLK